ncbi:hypothetical protein RSAG8_12734, partial [Rhizoctonia solani AG-8 WAC10335]
MTAPGPVPGTSGPKPSTLGPRLIVVYAGYGDTLLIEYDDPTLNNPNAKGYWLIDGGPVTSSTGPRRKPKSGSASTSKDLGAGEGDEKPDDSSQTTETKVDFKPGSHAYQAYYQFLKQTLLRYCRSDKHKEDVDLLKGITVTHPHADHMDGIIQLIADWLPDSSPDPHRPQIKLLFNGPIIVNDDFMASKKVVEKEDGTRTTETPRGATLWNLLKRKGFRRELIPVVNPPKDDSIPREISNVCLGGPMWKLWRPKQDNPVEKHDAETNVNPKQLGRRKPKAEATDVDMEDTEEETPAGTSAVGVNIDLPEVKTPGKGALKWSVDDSEANMYSIITTWNDKSYPPIVTTGDSIGSKILDSVEGLNSDSGRLIGVFKVPHHGSRRNSQPNDQYEVRIATSNVEANHYLFFRYVCWYLSGNMPDTATEEDRTLVTDFKTAIEDDFAEQWNTRQTNDAIRFTVAMDELAQRFRTYIAGSNSEPRLFVHMNTTFNLSADDGLLAFWMFLVRRNNLILERLYTEHRGSAGAFDTMNILEGLQPRLSLTKYLKSSAYLDGLSLSVPTEDEDSDGPTKPKRPRLSEVPSETPGGSGEHESGGSTENPLPVGTEMAKLLAIDPNSIIQFRLGIREFYRKVRQVIQCSEASNYVISANGKFDHPNPGTVAGIMAAAIERNVEAEAQGKRTEICRIFVTTGAALRVNQILTITKNLLKGHYEPGKVPGEEKWSAWIEVYYLHDDYCAAIPTSDRPELEGWKKVREFNRASAYDIPRANELSTSSFRLLTTNPDKMTIKSTGKVEGEVAGDAEAGVRIERHEENRPIVSSVSSELGYELGAPGSHFVLVPDAQNGESYYKLAVNDTRSKSITLKLESSSENMGAKFTIMSKKGGKTLCYQGDKLVFAARSKNAAHVVYVRIERVTGFGAPGLFTTPTPPSVPGASTFTLASAPSFEASTFAVGPAALFALPEFEPLVAIDPIPARYLAAPSSPPSHIPISEPFKSWWKKKSTDPSSTVNLRDVANDVLGDLPSTAVFREIPSVESGFILAGIGEYQVDIDDPQSAHTTEPTSVTCALIPPSNPPLIFPNFAGLGKVDVQSVLATISTKPPSLKLSLTMTRPKGASCTFTFEGDVPLLRYLQDVGYKGVPESVDVASLAASIVGPNVLWAFYSDLPSVLHSVISQSLHTSADPLKTKIEFKSSPFGPKVQSASIAIKLPTDYSMTFGPIPVPIPVVNATLAINNVGYGSFNLVLEFAVEITSNGKKLPFSFSAARNGLEPVVLDFVAGSKTSPSGILDFLGLNASPSSVALPLGNDKQDLGVDVQNIGFTLSQPYAGSHGELDLTSIYFSIGDNKSQDETRLSQWRDVLPNSILPEPSTRTLTDWSLKVAILNPKSSFSVGVRLDFGITIDPKLSNLRFQASRWPVKDLPGSYTTSVGFWADERSKLKTPTITDILQKITGRPSESIAESIPILGPILDKTSITHGLLAVQDQKVVLPSMDMTGGMSIRNLSDDFTFDALAKAINPQADLEKVPIIGGKTLASLRLEKASLEIDRSKEGYSISAFEIALDWNPESRTKIGELETFGNRLSIGMYKASSADSIVSIAGSGKPDTEQTWFVRWEGGVFDKWHLSASLEYSKSGGENLVVLSGVIFNPHGSVNPAGLIGAWSGSSLADTNSLWGETVPQNVKQSFQLQECTVSAAIGSTTRTFACSARATWGLNGQVSGVLLIDKHNPTGSDSKWGFAFALDVREFRFQDLAPDSPLAEQIDDVFHIKQVSVLVFNNPGNMGLSRISELIGNASGSSLLPSKTSFLPTKDLDETTFDKRVSDIREEEPSTSEKPKVVHKAGLAILARFNFSDAKSGSLADNLNSVARTKLPEVDLMGYFGKIAQAKSAEGKPAEEKSVVAFKASISPFNPLSSVEMKKIELTYAPEVEGSGKITNEFSLAAECAIDFENNIKWEIGANLTITKQDATLKTNLAQKPLELGPSFSLSNIELIVKYKFGRASETPSGDSAGGNPDNGALSSSNTKPSRSPSFDLSLSGEVTLGSLKAKVSAIFDSQKPGALMFEARDQWSISDLFNKIFSGNLPSDLLDIKFSNFIMYYAWKEMEKSSGEIKSFKEGFHAKSGVNLFGVSFSLSIDINRRKKETEDKTNEGITIAGEKTKPVKVLALTLRGAEDPSKGPKFAFSTGPSKECSIATGVALFDRDLGTATVKYEFGKSRFTGTVRLPKDIPILSEKQVEFELTEQKGKNVLRIVGIPAMFDNLPIVGEIFNQVKLLRKDKCEVFADELKKFVKTAFHVKLEVPKDHKGLSPEKGDESASKLKLSLNPSVDVTIAAHPVEKFDFGPFYIHITIPTGLKLDAFANSFWKTLNDSVPDIVRALLTDENIEKLAGVLAIVAAEKAIVGAASKLICRQKNSSEISGLGGLGGLLGGIAGGIAGGILGGVLGSVLSRDRDKSPPSKPTDNPEPPAPPSPGPMYAIEVLLRNALLPEEKFTQWEACHGFTDALKAARDCALEYYSAIRVLGEILGPRGVPRLLGNKTFNYYRYRYRLLQYDLSTLGKRFADRWLKKPDGPITFTPRSTFNGLMLDVSWESLGLGDSVGAIVGVTVNGKDQTPQAFEAHIRATTITVPSSEANPNITVKVAPFCGIRGSKSSAPEIELEKAGTLADMPLYLAHLDASPQSKLQPPFAELNYPASVADLKKYPVLLMGSLTWWPIRYGDSHEGLTLLGFDQTRQIKRDLTDSHVTSGQIGSIRVNTDEKNVEVYDTAGKILTTFGFSLFPVIRESAVGSA